MNDEQAEKLPKFVCNECNKTIHFICDYLEKVKQIDAKLRSTLLNMNVNTKSQKFKCPECRKTYVKYTNFQMHKKSHATLFCFTCDFIFDDQNEKYGHSCNNSSNTSDSNEISDSVYSMNVKSNIDLNLISIGMIVCLYFR